ncbi:hypothetical protein C9374_007148 [Naegleria lovaniensis]|uniref:RPGR-interacting protein 1 first C2 domain-containing protein n=1 Tax=Naegleria lovaniensis TaxID=51637 RepID=A0AA88H6V5_NAELO|nr:uncharacterized protein C9374_007148 [Naegleria lovaniensis]KAG2393617.1 hypothetical protein C9374_007148 [Naegleria lovaniensis]
MPSNNQPPPSSMMALATSDLKSKQEHEMEMLSLQHELRSKNAKIKQLQSKYDQTENNFKYILNNHKELINRLSEIERDLKEERERNSDLQNKIQLQQIEIAKLSDSEEKNKKLRQEIESLKKVNKNLQDTLLDTEKLKEKKQNKKYETIIEQLKQEIKQWNDKFSEQHTKYTKIVSKYKIQEAQMESLMEKKEKRSVPTQTTTTQILDADVQTIAVSKPLCYHQAVQVNIIQPEPPKKEYKPPVIDWRPPVQIIKDEEPMIDVVKSTYKPEVIIIEKPTLISTGSQQQVTHKPPSIKPAEVFRREESPKMPPPIEQVVLPQKAPSEKEKSREASPVVVQPKQDASEALPQPKEIKVSFTEPHSENRCTVRLFNIIPNLTYFFKEWENLPFFLSVDFFKHETQLSNLTNGVSNELMFERIFEFENNQLFLYYLANGSIVVQLTLVHSIDNCEVIGQGEIYLSNLIKDGFNNLVKGTITLYGKANKTQMATVDYEIQLKDSISRIVSPYKSEELMKLFSDKIVAPSPITDHTKSQNRLKIQEALTSGEFSNIGAMNDSNIQSSIGDETLDNDQHASYLDEELLSQQVEVGDISL